MDANSKKRQVVVSMTSFPAAIPYALEAIKSILAGSVLPDKIVLYLTYSQFEDGKLPEALLALSASHPIFEVRNYDRDIRSYRKLIPALADFPEAIIVTVDDDVRYHRHMLRDLLKLHARMPHAVLAHRAKRIRLGLAYKHWKKYRWYHFLRKRIIEDPATLQTGVAGVLYPPHSLNPEMLDADIFTELAPTTDDIWFWAAAVSNGYNVVPVPFGHNKPRSLGKPKALSLKTTNFKSDIDRNSQALYNILDRYPHLLEIISQRERGCVKTPSGKSSAYNL